MKYRNLMLALASCFFVASCSKEEIETLPQNEGDVVFTASMRTVARATETSFEEGDKIGVYAVSAQENTASQLLSKGNYADNVCYTYSGGKFVNQQGIVRPTDGGLRYYAIYPYMTSCGANFRFSVKTNQASSGQYTASDLCTVVSDITADKEVDLTFSHRLSHVIINLEGEALGTGTAAVKLNNVNIGCDVDLNANTFTAYESRSTVVCADNGTNSYKAIIAPQTIEEGTILLTITLNGKDYVFKTTSDLCFASGKQQVFNLTIEKDEIVSFTGEILPWGEEVEEEVKVYVAGMYDGLWDGYVPCIWIDGEMQRLGMFNYDDGGTYGCVSSMAVSGNNIYVGGWTNPPLSSEADAYTEIATIWKNGAYLYGGWGGGLDAHYSYVYDMDASENDVVATMSGCTRVWKNGEFLPYSYKINGTSYSPYRVYLSDGDLYVLCRNKKASNVYTYCFWKNEEQLSYVIELDDKLENDVYQFSVQNGNIYCLIEQKNEFYLWKNGEMITTGLKQSYGLIGPTYKPMFVDGDDVYIVGQQNGTAKIWQNGKVSLLTDETNRYPLTGVYVYNKDVYVVGYDVIEDFSAPVPPYQHGVIKLWKNGKEFITSNCEYIAYPCNIVVTSANNK